MLVHRATHTYTHTVKYAHMLVHKVTHTYTHTVIYAHMLVLTLPSPDSELNDIMMEGCSLMSNSGEGERAMVCFQKLIDKDPEFAEVRVV